MPSHTKAERKKNIAKRARLTAKQKSAIKRAERLTKKAKKRRQAGL